MSIINIGLSGLSANRVALNITALNTANANSLGYTRQVVDFGSVGGGQVAGLGVGAGVEVQGIRRVMDMSANRNLRDAVSELGYSAAVFNALSYLEETLGADGLQVNQGLDDFFTAVNAANPEPSSPALRLQIIQKASLLAQSVSQSQSKVIGTADNQIGQFDTQLGLVNSDLQLLAELNGQIQKLNTSSSDKASLLDQVDTVINRLSGQIGVEAIFNGDGTVEVSLPSGEPLVNGETASVLSRNKSNGPYSTELDLSFGNSTFKVIGGLGGALGGSSDVISQEVLPLMKIFDDIAVSIADEVNAALGTGFDLQGNPGQPLFTYNPANPAQTLAVNNITVEELALSSDGNKGDGGILHLIADVAEKGFNIGVNTNVTLSDGYVITMDNLGASTSKNMSLKDISMSRLESAQAARDSVSAVSSDEEAANLMVFMNAYNANLKVVSAGNDMFQSILAVI